MSVFDTVFGPLAAIHDFDCKDPLEKVRPLKWSEARRMALGRDRICMRCGSAERRTVHHVWPRRLGGGHELYNLITLCEPCHQQICTGCSREWAARIPEWAQSGSDPIPACDTVCIINPGQQRLPVRDTG